MWTFFLIFKVLPFMSALVYTGYHLLTLRQWEIYRYVLKKPYFMDDFQWLNVPKLFLQYQSSSHVVIISVFFFLQRMKEFHLQWPEDLFFGTYTSLASAVIVMLSVGRQQNQFKYWKSCLNPAAVLVCTSLQCLDLPSFCDKKAKLRLFDGNL